MTKTHSFTLFVEGADLLSDAGMEALCEAGCDDATPGARDGLHYAAFDRKAASADAALTGAIDDLARALPDLAIVRVEPDDLVNMATSAKRTGRLRASS